MADPNPKRAKMDNPNGRSGSTRPEDRKIQPKGVLVDTRTQDFGVIRNMRGFVDHTHFIQSFLLKGEPKLAIFAPRRFGKSSHLNMVKMFLQIDVDEITGEVSSSMNGPAKGRKNYEVFDGTRVITDDNYKYLVEDHLGKHPVIHLDLKAASIDSVEKARMHCRRAVHRAYLEHSYLETSTKLVPSNEKRNAECQDICKQWCNLEQFQTQDLDDCLRNLSRFLYNHFNEAKVYILVDEFDAINASALHGVRGNSVDDTVKKLRNICDILAGILGPATKGGHAYVAGALITGVLSYMPGPGYSSFLNNFTVMKFLDSTKILPTDKDFVPFYGATNEEVRSLIQKLVQDKELVKFEGKEEFLNDTNELDADKIMADVHSRYNGYCDKEGTRILCLWSVLQYLQSGNARIYWSQTDGIPDLFKILKYGNIVRKLMQLVQWGIIEFKRCDRMTIRDLVKLHDIMQAAIVDEAEVMSLNHDVIFSFLIDQGYLHYLEGGPQEQFRVPNSEIRVALSNVMTNICEKVWDVTTNSRAELLVEPRVVL